jgi:RimJ/RimL family protein N-acetyltransferase
MLREPIAEDLPALVELLRLPDASRFGIDGPLNDAAVLAFIERAVFERRAGTGFAFTITLHASSDLVGLARIRQLDLGFDAAEWEITLAPAARGTGVFVETARLVGSFAFGSVGARRLEARVRAENGRASAALRKLGAVEEGILRRSLRRGSDYVDQVLWSVLKEEWGDQVGDR